MSVYVDPLMYFGWKLRGRPTKNCHLFADTEEELHQFAAMIGIKRAWFQAANKDFPHYDLTPNRREDAVNNGAIEMSKYEMVAFVQKRRELPHA